MTTQAPPETNAERIAREQAERNAKAQSELLAADEAVSDQRPHLMHLGVDGGARVRVDCPGKEHCALWYADPMTADGRCGFQVEISEIGYEMLEYHLGPAFWPTTNPFPVRFRWSGHGFDEPPEIEWWPVPADDSPAVAEGDRSDRERLEAIFEASHQGGDAALFNVVRHTEAEIRGEA